ncbi:MAG TPA: aldo/keto reductase [Lachnospiraceae bacterium]
MKKIKLSDSLELSTVVAGCMRVKDAGIDGQTLRSFVNTCLEMGIDTFDHAPVYGAGYCEEFFGKEVLSSISGIRDKVKIVTKAGITLPGQKNNSHIFYDSTKKNLQREIDDSLKRLRTDYVDLWLLHRPDVLGNPEEIAEALEQIVASGKVLNIGVSNYEPEQFDALQSYLKVPLVANQMEFSVKATYNFFNGVIDNAFKNKIKLMAWSPLGGGSVFKEKETDGTNLYGCIETIAKNHNVDMDTIMYAWLMTHPVNFMVITGTMNPERLKHAVEAAELNLSYDEWYAILAASRGFDVP